MRRPLSTTNGMTTTKPELFTADSGFGWNEKKNRIRITRPREIPVRSAAAKRLTPDLRISEAHGETENFLLLRVNLPGLQIDAQRHADPGDVHRCVEAALGEDVDQHHQGGRVLEEQVFGVDAGDARDRVANHDGHHLAFNELDYPPEGFWLLHLVAIHPPDEVLAGVPDDFAGQRQPPKPV